MRCSVPLLKRPAQDSEQARVSFRAAWTLAALAMGLAGMCNLALADQTVVIDGAQSGKQFDGIGAVSAGGATSVLLKDYPETQRRQILDLLFKPNFGASISVLFVEVGGDGNSTQGVELSHMHARNDQNYSRGYEWWLMREAKQRNPDLALDACAWSAPAWVGNGQYFSQDMCDYYANWIVGLKEHYGLQLDAIGCRNERGVNVNFAKMFRRTLDARRLKQVRIHAFDNWNRDKWDWCRKLEADTELRDSIDILSNHTLSCVYENNGPTPDWVKALADRFHKPIWDTEEHVYLDGYTCELMLVKSLNGNFLDAGATRTVNWYLVDAMYGVEPFKIKPGMLVADSPWSGHYAVREALWGYAHYGQFSKIGWQYLPKACGRLTGGGTYVTLKSPETDYSVILETGGAKASQTVTFKLAGGVSTGRLCLWRSNSREQFARQPDLEPVDGMFQFTADPDSIYSLSTTTGQRKGSFADIPADRPFPLPYHEPFDGYTPASAWGYLPHYTADISGAFELAQRPDGKGQCLRQITERRGSNWGAEWNTFTILGDAHWKDYEIACDVTISDGKGWAGLLGRVAKSDPPPKGYLFRLSADGTGGLYSTVPPAKKGGQLRQLSTFALQHFDPKKWHRLRLRFSGSSLTGFVDGAQVCQADDKECAEGLAGLIAGEEDKARTTACFSDLIIQKPDSTAPVPPFAGDGVRPMYPR